MSTSPANAALEAQPELRRQLVVLGASAGGLDALRTLLAGLPPDFAAAVLIVVHSNAASPRLLADILDKVGPLRVAYAEDGAPLVFGEVRVAVPDLHLVVQPGVTRLVRGPRENRSRPAIDTLFRSAAWAYGPRVVGMVLSGMLSDGTAGLWAIKTCGGIVVAQDPADAKFAEMPQHALEHIDVDFCVSAADAAPLLQRLTTEPLSPQAMIEVPEQIKMEVRMVASNEDNMGQMDQIGKLSPYTCPACQGSLWEVNDEHLLRYRCHTGHALSAEDLSFGQTENVEEAMFAAVRALEESGRLSDAIAARSRSNQRETMALTYETMARDARSNAEVLRALLFRQRAQA